MPQGSSTVNPSGSPFVVRSAMAGKVSSVMSSRTTESLGAIRNRMPMAMVSSIGAKARLIGSLPALIRRSRSVPSRASCFQKTAPSVGMLFRL